MYCPKCGTANDDNNFRCTGCGQVLHGAVQRPVVVDDTTSGLIPTKNPNALIAYYLAVFSLIPCTGLFTGIAALILGLKGLSFGKEHPEVKGIAHAWVGIILGGL